MAKLLASLPAFDKQKCRTGFIHLLFPNFGKLETFQIYFPIFGKIFFQFSNFWKNDFPKIGKQIGNFPIFQILEKADEWCLWLKVVLFSHLFLKPQNSTCESTFFHHQTFTRQTLLNGTVKGWNGVYPVWCFRQDTETPSKGKSHCNVGGFRNVLSFLSRPQIFFTSMELMI